MTMNRVTIEYCKAGICGLLTALTVIAIAVGGGPGAYSAGMLTLPVVMLALTGFFCWKAEAFKSRDQ